jgi:hypothetical protein
MLALRLPEKRISMSLSTFVCVALIRQKTARVPRMPPENHTRPMMLDVDVCAMSARRLPLIALARRTWYAVSVADCALNRPCSHPAKDRYCYPAHLHTLSAVNTNFVACLRRQGHHSCVQLRLPEQLGRLCAPYWPYRSCRPHRHSDHTVHR